MSTKPKGILNAHHSVLAVAHRLLDMAVIVLCSWWANWLGGTLGSDTATLVVLAVVIFHWLAEYNKMYHSWRGERVQRELLRVFNYWAVTFVVVMLVDYLLLHPNTPPNQEKLTWFVSVLVVLCLYRVVFRSVLQTMRRRGFNTRNVAIVGTGQVGERLAQSISEAPWMGLHLMGFYDDHPQPMDQSDLESRVPVVGGLARLVVDARAGRLDKVYITLSMSHEPAILELVRGLSDTTVSVYLIPDVFMFDLLHARAETINGLTSISLVDSPMDGSSALIKRLEDIVVSSMILAIIAIPLLVIAAAIKFTSKGPVLFRQTRYGLDGRPIMVWKFRSMSVQENGATVTQASRGDTRITPLGAILRKTSLDELPQFFNVLKGDMSIVGPRPHAVAHNEQYRTQVNGYMLRHKVKPGITGWAQVNGWRGETDTLDKMQKRIEFDLEYIEHWSVWMDIKIIFLTLFKGFVNKNAY